MHNFFIFINSYNKYEKNHISRKTNKYVCIIVCCFLDERRTKEEITMTSSNEVLSLKFNRNFSCFICGMHDGIRVFNTEPLVEKLFLSTISIDSQFFFSISRP